MIKLLGLLFTFTFLYSGETIYILPAQQSRFVHQLNQVFKNASERIVILSPAFNHSELKKGILQAAKHGTDITMFIQNLQNDPLSMIQYEHINLYHYTPTPRDTSIILVDNTYVCTLSGTIDEARLKSAHTTIRCSDEPQKIELLNNSLNLHFTHSKPYLE